MTESSDIEASVKTEGFADFKQTKKQKIIKIAQRVILGVFRDDAKETLKSGRVVEPKADRMCLPSGSASEKGSSSHSSGQKYIHSRHLQI